MIRQYKAVPIVIIVSGTWLLCLLFSLGFFDHWAWMEAFLGQPAEIVARRGQLGDSFGMVNALFSGGALLLVAYTNWMQSQELRMQRGEMSAQREQMELQNQSFGRQMVENTFFEMLNAFMSLTDHIDVDVEGGHGEGKEAFNLLANHFEKELQSQPTVDPLVVYQGFYDEFGHEIGHYFRTMYNLFRFVDEFGGEKSKLYARIARAQLTAPELYLLFFNCLDDRNAKFVELIRKFNILKYFNPDRIPQAMRPLLDSRFQCRLA